MLFPCSVCIPIAVQVLSSNNKLHAFQTLTFSMTPFTRLTSKSGVGNVFPAQTNCVVKTKYVVKNTATFNPHLMFLHSPGLLVILGYHAFTSIALMMFLLIMARQILLWSYVFISSSQCQQYKSSQSQNSLYCYIIAISCRSIQNCIAKAKSERRKQFIGNQYEDCRDLSGLYYLLPFQKVSMTELNLTPQESSFIANCYITMLVRTLLCKAKDLVRFLETVFLES